MEQINSQKTEEPTLTTQEVEKKPHILKEFPKKGKESRGTLLVVLGSVFVVLAGVITGWFISGGTAKSGSSTTIPSASNLSPSVTEIGEVKEGVSEAEGKLVEGGIEGEGTYHLEREGGPSRYVYLTSTALDLQPFVGKKVKVWGETLSGVKAPWLMDVVKIKLIE